VGRYDQRVEGLEVHGIGDVDDDLAGQLVGVLFEDVREDRTQSRSAARIQGPTSNTYWVARSARTVGYMQGAPENRRRKRRSDRAVVAGLSLIVVALLVSSRELAPALATTLAATIGFALVIYGVHVAWLVFYDREPDGPSS
jgi:hypothetical protein